MAIQMVYFIIIITCCKRWAITDLSVLDAIGPILLGPTLTLSLPAQGMGYINISKHVLST